MNHNQKIKEITLELLKEKKINQDAAFKILKALPSEKESNVNKVKNQDIAVIGMACKLPNASGVNEYWHLITNKISGIKRLPSNRRKDIELLIQNIPNLDKEEPYQMMGYLDEIDHFDPQFFNITPKEAAFLDPMQRILLGTIWQAFEDACFNKEKLYCSNTGVFVGRGHVGIEVRYSDLLGGFEKTIPDELMVGSISGIIASRISYWLDLQGPSIITDTVCSSSLVSLHQACQSLLLGECEQAVAAGICVYYLPIKKKSLIISPDGNMSPFDKKANGTVWGEGASVLLLKPLEKAIADRDNIHAVIKSTVTNQDGASNGVTAPNAKAQEKLIINAWKKAGIDPESISYIEAHGTGTVLGDPIEISGITNAFSQFTDKKQFCGIGSVKANIGHLAAPSGISSVIKVILALKNQQLPPIMNFEEANSYIDFMNSPLYVSDHLKKWEKNGSPLRAGVNSFGLSGTNAHAILEEAPQIQKGSKSNFENKIFTLSAKTEASLEKILQNYIDFLDNKVLDIDDLCYSANACRGHYEYRILVVAHSTQDLREKLSKINSFDYYEDQNQGIFVGKSSIVSENKEHREQGEITEHEKNELSKKAKKLLKQIMDEKDESLFLDLATFYIQGAFINWKEIYKNESRNKISLPVYQFDEKRYWLEKEQISNEKSFEKNMNVPLIDVCLAKTIDTQLYATRMNNQSHWEIKDHKVKDKHFLVGTAYLELILEAAEAYYQSNSLKLEQVVLLSPLIIDENEEREIHTILKEDQDELSFEIVSKVLDQEEVEWISHAKGKLALNNEAPKKTDIEQIKKALNIQCPIPDVFSNDSFSFGKQWNSLKEAYTNEEYKEAFLYLELAEDLKEEAAKYILHPALCDVAFNFFGLLKKLNFTSKDKSVYLPFYYESINIYRPLESKIYSHFRFKEENPDSKIIDIAIYALDGSLLLEIQNYQVRKLKNLFINKDSMYHSFKWINQELAGKSIIPIKNLQPELYTLFDQEKKSSYTYQKRDSFHSELNKLAFSLILNAFQKLGLSSFENKTMSTHQLMQELSISSKKKKFFFYLLKVLCEKNIIESPSPNHWKINNIGNLDQIEKLSEQVNNNLNAIAKEEIELILKAGTILKEVLTAEIDGNKAIFSDWDLISSFYNKGIAPFDSMILASLKLLLEKIPKNQPIKILEVGAGTGSIPAVIFPLLSDYQVEYYYTDISSSFFAQAQKRFKNYSFVQYKILDIDSDAVQQGFLENSFDFVFSANVLHATKSLKYTLKNISRLLAPSGVLALLETTKSFWWFNLIFGLTDGWWNYQDTSLRSEHALISIQKWKSLLKESGFEQTISFAPPHDEEKFTLSLFISQKSKKPIEKVASSLFESTKIKNLNLKNKAVRSATFENLYDKNSLKDLVLLYENLSKNNVGLLITGNFAVANSGQYNINDQQIIKELPKLTEACHKYNTQILMQLSYIGDRIPFIASFDPKNRNPIKYEDFSEDTPNKMSSKKIKLIKESFIESALLAYNSGFDGIQLHGAHGYLLSQFLSPYFNQREDKYGGNTENRCRLILEIAKEIKEKTNPDFILSIKVNCHDYTEDGITQDEFILICRQLDKYFDILEISGGLLEFSHKHAQYFKDEYSHFRYNAQIAKENFFGKVILVGNNRKLELCNEILDKEEADLISFSRPLIAEPNLLDRWQKGVSDKAACINCGLCLSKIYKNKIQCWQKLKKIQPETVLIFIDTKGLSPKIADKFKAEGKNVIQVQIDEKYQKISEQAYTLSSNYEDFLTLLEELRDMRLSKVIFLNPYLRYNNPQSLLELQEATENSLFVFYRFIKAFNECKINHHIQLYLIADHAFEVNQNEAFIKPWNASFYGLSTVIKKENTNIECINIDLDDKTNIDSLYPLLNTEIKHNDIALRENHLFVKYFDRTDINELPQRDISIKENGTYLISGGRGGIGLEIANYLASLNKVNLILLNRSVFPQKEEWNALLEKNEDSNICSTIKKLQAIESSGSKVICMSANISNEPEMKKIISQIKADFSKIDGIVHAAGSIRDNLIENTSEKDFKEVIDPKISGTWILDHLTKEDKLDFFILFSSMATLFGNIGQGNYVSANYFLDSYPHYLAKNQRNALTINWGLWKEVGMAAASKDKDERLSKPISNKEGLNAFNELLNKNNSRVFVGKINYASKSISKLENPPFVLSETLKDLLKSTKNTPSKTKPKASKKQQKQIALKGRKDDNYFELEIILAEIWCEILGFDEIDIYDNFYELGGDSISATRMISYFEKMNIELELSDLFEYPSIYDLSKKLQDKKGDASSLKPETHSNTEEVELMSDQKDDFGISFDISDEIEINGIKIHYEYFGKKEKDTLIFFNGVTMQTTSWYQFVPDVIESYDVLLWDFRGQGASTKDDQPYSIAEMAEYLKTIIDHLNLKPSHINLLGISSGSTVALEFLRKYPSYVNKVIFSGIPLINDPHLKDKNEIAQKIYELDFSLWIRMFIGHIISENFLDVFKPEVLDILNKRLIERYQEQHCEHSIFRLYEAILEYVAQIESFKNDFLAIKSDILNIVGEYDRFTPKEEQKLLKNLFKKVQYVEFKESGHLVILEKQKEFTNYIRDFLSNNPTLSYSLIPDLKGSKNIVEAPTAKAVKNLEHNLNSSLKEQFTENQITCSYRYFGEKKKPCILFLFDPSLKSDILLPFISSSALFNHFDLLLIDFELENKDRFEIEDCAQNISHIIQNLNLSKNSVFLIGLNEGSLIASELLRNNEPIINKAILSGIILSDEKLYNYNVKTSQELLDLDYSAYKNSHISNRINANLYKSLKDPYIEKIKEILYPQKVKAITKTFYAARKSYIEKILKGLITFKNVSTPTLFISGDQDNITPFYVQEEAINLFNNAIAKHIEIKDSSHYQFIDSSQQFFDLINKYFSESKEF